MKPLKIVSPNPTRSLAMYDERLVAPMRQELVQLGFKEMHTAPDVDSELKDLKGTALVVVNSICGCAAGRARPGVALAMRHGVLPDKLLTVFAGNDLEATAQVRSYFTGYRPSSPQMGLLKDGKVVFMLERSHIERREASEIAADLVRAFDEHCR